MSKDFMCLHEVFFPVKYVLQQHIISDTRKGKCYNVGNGY